MNQKKEEAARSLCQSVLAAADAKTAGRTGVRKLSAGQGPPFLLSGSPQEGFLLLSREGEETVFLELPSGRYSYRGDGVVQSGCAPARFLRRGRRLPVSESHSFYSRPVADALVRAALLRLLRDFDRFLLEACPGISLYSFGYGRIFTYSERH